MTTHPIEGLVSEIKEQIKKRDFVNIVIDKKTIDKMRLSLRIANEKAVAVSGTGVDKRIKNFGIKTYTIREDANWIKAYIKRGGKIIDHRLKFFVGGTEITIMSSGLDDEGGRMGGEIGDV